MTIHKEEVGDLLKAGIICKLAYQEYIPENILNLANVEEALFIKHPKRHHIRVWIMYMKRKMAYVTFRGTDSLNTAIINTHAALVKDSEVQGCIHKGYKDMVLHTMDLIGDKLDNVDNMILSGHSMGGACAQILGAMLPEKTEKELRIISFGSPPVGDQEFASFYRKKIKNCARVVHEYDIIPRLPIPFFKHTYGLRLIEHQPGEVRPCPKRPYTAQDLSKFIRYHQMNSYITPLRKMV